MSPGIGIPKKQGKNPVTGIYSLVGTEPATGLTWKSLGAKIRIEMGHLGMEQELQEGRIVLGVFYPPTLPS